MTTGHTAGLGSMHDVVGRQGGPRVPAAVLLAQEMVRTLLGGLVYGQDFWQAPTLEDRVRAQRDGLAGEAHDRAWRRF